MTTKKIKLADIAKEVGCSTATVSYVLNNDPKQKINEETRRKILQVSSILGYQKNTIANALATGKSNCIGFYIGSSSFPLATTDKFNFFSEIVEALALNGYHSILLAGSISKEVPFVDAIICIDFSEENFITVCSNNIIPVIGIDTHAHEPWIFEISSDISDIKERYYIDDYILFSYDLNSSNLKNDIVKNNENTYFISSFVQLEMISKQLQNKKIVVCGDSMYDYLKGTNNEIIKYSIDNNKKINKLISCLKLAINHTEADSHVYKIN